MTTAPTTPSAARPRDAEGWAVRLAEPTIPVLADTANALEALRRNEDAVDPHLIADMMYGDPLMTLKVFVHLAANRREQQVTDVVGLTPSLVLLGVAPFFRAFGPQPALDEVLAQDAEALAIVHGIVRRAHRAARFALAFAVQRHEPDAVAIHQATLLHDVAEMLLWIHAPDAARAVVEQHSHEPEQPSANAQQRVLGTRLPDIQAALMRRWRLPDPLRRMGEAREPRQPGTVMVELALRIARHSVRGWDHPALAADIGRAAELLKVNDASVSELLLDVDA